MYGYQDSGDLAPGKQGGKFGLNTGAFITKFARILFLKIPEYSILITLII